MTGQQGTTGDHWLILVGDLGELYDDGSIYVIYIYIVDDMQCILDWLVVWNMLCFHTMWWNFVFPYLYNVVPPR